jgi:dipeptidyl aminopeptidase/acylaminoacyl peptidase
VRIGSSKTKWAASSASDSVQTKTQDQIRVPRRLNRVLCLLLALAVSLALVIIQQTNALIQHRTPVDLLLDPLENAQKFRQIAISPDGQRVAWVEEANASSGGIFVCTLAAPETTRHRITAGDGDDASDEHSIAWSPNSSELAFLSNAQSPDQMQLYVAKIAGGEARKLTDLQGSLESPAWSPDGKTVALLFTENAPRQPGPLEPMPLPSGVIASKIYEQRLITVDVASGRTRQISPADMYVYEYDWSPDSTQFAMIAANGAGDANWWNARLYTLQASSGELKSIYRPELQIAVPRWSPDGKSIAFIGGLMSDEGSVGGDVFLVPAAGGVARDLTPGMKASASSLIWRPGGNQILLLESLDGASGIAAVDVRTTHLIQLWRGPETLSVGRWNFDLSTAKDGVTSAIMRESFSSPPELWAGSVGSWRSIPVSHPPMHPEWGRSENVHWQSDGIALQGWLTFPQDYDPAKRYPLVVEIHGGPGAMARPMWPSSFFDFTLLSHYGYFVLRPNPRGSFGQGEAFTRGNVKDFGYGDLRDILAGVDEVVKHYPIDDSRAGIGGWSYGGYMAMWAVTQTHRFHAAVAGAGIANWQSYYGENDIDQWMIPFFGASVYDDPAVYARSSPITFIKNAKTPTLILVGDRDGECPTPQSFEFWHALETLGVENQFVVYPSEGHMIYDPTHRRDILERTLDWYDRHLKLAAN